MLARIATSCDRINRTLGRLTAGAALLLILVQFGFVTVSQVFDVGSIWVQESRLYINSFIFLGAAGLTLLEDGHVRVDVIYRELRPDLKVWVDLVGGLVFLLPLVIVLWWAVIPYVGYSWAVREGSVETGGLQFVYIHKSLIILFALTLTLTLISTLCKKTLHFLATRGDG